MLLSCSPLYMDKVKTDLRNSVQIVKYKKGYT